MSDYYHQPTSTTGLAMPTNPTPANSPERPPMPPKDASTNTLARARNQQLHAISDLSKDIKELEQKVETEREVIAERREETEHFKDLALRVNNDKEDAGGMKSVGGQATASRERELNPG